jgi:hypothetical protein
MNSSELGPSLRAAYARVPDVRRRRSPLPALLTLATAAMLCGARSVYAIAQWGRRQPEAVRRALGFRGSHMPGNPARHDVFKRLDVVAFETALPTWAAQPLDARTQPLDARTQPLVLDGKALRGIHGDELPGVRVVAVYAPEAGLVLAPAGGQDPGGAGGDR